MSIFLVTIWVITHDTEIARKISREYLRESSDTDYDEENITLLSDDENITITPELGKPETKTAKEWIKEAKYIGFLCSTVY